MSFANTTSAFAALNTVSIASYDVLKGLSAQLHCTGGASSGGRRMARASSVELGMYALPLAVDSISGSQTHMRTLPLSQPGFIASVAGPTPRPVRPDSEPS